MENFYEKAARKSEQYTLIKEAEKRFPKGTKFTSPFSGKQYTSTGEFTTPNLPYHNDIEVMVEESSCGVYVRLDGKWAEGPRKCQCDPDKFTGDPGNWFTCPNCEREI